MTDIERLRQGVEGWNQWRVFNPDHIPDLRFANLTGANLSSANLIGADMSSRHT